MDGLFSPQPIGSIGDGYNVFTGSALPTGLKPLASTSGPTSESANAYVCTKTEDIYKYLGIEADVSVENPWGSFNQKIEFVKTLNITTMSIAILVRAARVSSTTTATGAVAFAAPPASALDLFKQSGNCYVSSFSVGGEFIAAYVFTAIDEDSFSSLETTATTQFGLGAWDFDATFEAKIQTISSSSGTSSSFQQTGIGFSTTPLPAPADFVNFVLNFSSVDLDGPTVLDFSLTSYSSVAGCPANFDQIDAYSNAYAGKNGYADKYSLALSRQLLVNEVSEFYSRYYSSDPQLSVVLTNLKQDQSQVEAWLNAVITDPTNNSIPDPEFSGIAYGYPVPQFALLQNAQIYGGGGGDPFTDVTIATIANGAIPSSFVIRGNGWVDRLVTAYATTEAEMPTVITSHGGDGGSDSQTFQLGSGEWVTGITVYYGEYMNQIQISTNLQDFPAEPPSPEGSNGPCKWTTPAGSMFVGWAGHSGGYLDSLQPIYVSFSAASWKDATAATAIPLPIKPGDVPADPSALDLVTSIGNWAAGQWPTIQQIFLQKGGWEGWAQVEIARMLQQQYPAATIIREDRVYQASQQRCDLSFALQGYNFQVIEIKCESLWQDSTAALAFCKAYEADLVKITQSKLTQASLPARVWAFGFTCSDQIASDMSKYPFGTLTPQYVKLGTSGTGDLYMWIFYRDVAALDEVELVPAKVKRVAERELVAS